MADAIVPLAPAPLRTPSPAGSPFDERDVPPGDADAGTDPVAYRIDRKNRSFGEVLAQWARIARTASPLFAPEFALLTAELLDERQPLIAGATRRGTLVAALPIARRGRTLVALRSDPNTRVDLVGDARATPSLWRAMRSVRGWETLELRGVPADSVLATDFPGIARRDGYRTFVREVTRAPWFDVVGVEQRIHRHFRDRMRSLERQVGGIELERKSAFDRVAIADLLRLEASSANAPAGAAASDAHRVRFYSALARVFARRGQLSVAFLRARGRRIAGCFALEDGTTFHILKLACDPEYARFGPAHLLIRETAADAERRGLTRYDLVGTGTPARMWTDRARSHVEVVAYAPSFRGRATWWTREVARPVAGRVMRAFAAARGTRGGPAARPLLGAFGAVAALVVGCGSTDAPGPPLSVQQTSPRAKASTPMDAAVLGSDALDMPVVAVEAGMVGTPDADSGEPGAEAAIETGAAEPTGPAVCGLSACAPGAPCPDLVVDQNDLRASMLISTRTFAPSDCAVMEGCIAQPGTRRLLRFDTSTANIGTGDLVVGSPLSSVCFQYSQCHMHYHFLGFSDYVLYESDGTTVAAVGHKQSFCLEDVEQYPADPAPQPSMPFSCTNQGLHVGWEDVYPNDIDCQWVDITGVPAGNYVLKVSINTAGYLPESDYTNDSATAAVTIPPE
jgi:CelD/BcsL family acetyltransferase involved in cellulose biosynthesis